MYVVNVNRPGYLPDYDGMEFESLQEAATTALDFITWADNGNNTVVDDHYNAVIDIESGYPYTGPFPIEVQAGDYVVFIALDPETCTGCDRHPDYCDCEG